MGGGLMQLVAYGAQDVQADFGRRVQCTVSRNGDLAYRTYLQVTLPEINQMPLMRVLRPLARLPR